MNASRGPDIGKPLGMKQAILARSGRGADGQNSRHARSGRALDNAGNIARKLLVVEMGVDVEKGHLVEG
jgi:hypothetical protein